MKLKQRDVNVYFSVILKETRNSHFYVSNPQKLGASRVCITFPQILKKY